MPSAPRLIRVTADPKSKVYGDGDLPPTYQVTSGSLVNGDGMVTVTFAGTPGAEYAVWACSDLTVPDWSNVSTNRAGEDGRWTFTESQAGLVARFSRSARP